MSDTTSTEEGAKQVGFGTFAGVYTPTVLTILGVVMYLRFGWVVGNAGLAGAFAIVAIAHVITITTGLSVASIATNRTVGAGGAYFMISRSLGGPAGAAIGIPLFLGQALGVTFYIVGFTEALAQLAPLPTGYEKLASQGISTLVLILLTFISWRSAELAMKTQYVVMGIIALSLVAFFAGTGDGNAPEAITWGASKGSVSFTEVFAVFFPAVTGVMAGVGMSGDLRDPRRAIPLGTLLAIGTGLVVYLIVPVWFALYMTPERLMTEMDAFWTVSAFGPLIYLGVWGATLSSALGTLLVAPRTLQALAKDRVGPRIFAKGHGPSNEPRIGTMFTFVLAEVGILIGDLDAVAPVLTMFMLATYGFTNLACGLEKWAASPSFRPTFKVSAWVSLFGALACFYVMSILNMLAMFAALAISLAIFLLAERRALGKSYGDARHGIWAALVRSALLRLRGASFHPQNWRPNLIIQGGEPEKRSHLLELGSAIVGERGIATYVQLLKGEVADQSETRTNRIQALNSTLVQHYPNVFFRVDIARNIYRGMVSVAQSYGMGSFEANTVMLGWQSKSGRRSDYGSVLRDLSHLDRSLLVVDYKAERGFGEQKNIHIWWRGLQGNGSLMLLVVFLLLSDRRWQNAEVTVLTVVDSEQDRPQWEKELQQVLEGSRIKANMRVLMRDQRSIVDVMRENSQGADLSLIGIGLPDSDEVAQAFFERTDALLEVLPTTLMVHSARDFDGDPVLFDAPTVSADTIPPARA